MDYEKIAEYQLELEVLAKVNTIGQTHDDLVKLRARSLKLYDLIAEESRKPTL